METLKPAPMRGYQKVIFDRGRPTRNSQIYPGTTAPIRPPDAVRPPGHTSPVTWGIERNFDPGTQASQEKSRF